MSEQIEDVPSYIPGHDKPVIGSQHREIMKERVYDSRSRSKKPYIEPPGVSFTGKPGQKPLVDLQVYPQQPPYKPKNTVDPKLFVPITTNPPHHPSYMGNSFIPNTGLYPMYEPNKQLQILQNYNISISGPNVHHSQISTLYEDSLPKKQMENGLSTINDRLTLYNIIRSNLLQGGDGNDISLDGGGDGHSIMSYLKFMDLDPYNIGEYQTNPYQNMPSGMLIYRSCYPIRHDKQNSTTICARNSVGINIRIYRLDDGSYNVGKNFDKEKEGINQYASHDIWREIYYYEYIREQILKKKVCPNFVCMYGYYICKKCDIDFDKIDHLKNKIVKHKDEYLTGKLANGKEYQYKNPKAITGNCLTALTESPTQNLELWASRIYHQDGNIKRMINTGVHEDKVWFSVLFQILAALYILQKHQFAFSEFNIQDNIYIRDINLNDNTNTSKYWKYVIDGIEYFVPNHGYLVLIDSNYRGSNSQSTIFNGVNPPNTGANPPLSGGGNSRKIIAKAFKDDNIDDKIKYAITKIFQRSEFVNNNTAYVPPNERVLKKMDDILKSTSEFGSNINKYIQEHMTMFMNNRIGTYLTETEYKNNIVLNGAKKFRNGDLVVNKVRNDTYKFVLYLGKNTENTINILTRNDDNLKSNNSDIIEANETLHNLFHYSVHVPIVQKNVPGNIVISEEGLLESYILE